MGTIFVGSEAMARREITRGRLRSSYRALFPDVYIPRIGAPSLYANTVGAWLWSDCRGVITGRAAAALCTLGQRKIADRTALEQQSPAAVDHRPKRAIHLRRSRRDQRHGRCNNPAHGIRSGAHLDRGATVAHLDSLARATGLIPEHVLPLAESIQGRPWGTAT